MLIHVLMALLTLAPQAPQTPQADRPIGWESIFNGKDLTGWVPVGNEKWTVEDGAIHGQGVTKEYGYLRTDKKYKDFQLTLRFKCEANGNSGVFFHAEFKEGVLNVRVFKDKNAKPKSIEVKVA